MAEMEDKLGAILGNPQMMQQIMAMAQSMGQQPQRDEPPEQEGAPLPPQSTMPAMPDAAMFQKIASIAGQTGVDSNQRALLSALAPYLNAERITRLEKAMRGAKIAGIAGTVLRNGGLSFLTGR